MQKACPTYCAPTQTERSEFVAVSLDNVAMLTSFATWIRWLDETDTSSIPRRRLLGLYWEYCDYFNLVPLSQGRFDRGLKSAGFTRRRLSAGTRPWVYSLVQPRGRSRHV
jgi:hypothetical protein